MQNGLLYFERKITYGGFRFISLFIANVSDGEQVLALITKDGEAIEGAAAEEVQVMGRVTYFINSTYADDESPV